MTRKQKRTQKRLVRSADGERGAVMGYRHQYLFSAAQILSFLRNGELESVRIADPEAGILDDLQVVTREQLHAYQVRWQEHPTPYGFSSFLGLLPRLVESWTNCRSIHPGKRVVVHLATNRHAAATASLKIPAGEPLMQHRTFAGFKDAWDAARLSTSLPPPEWQQAFAECAAAAGLAFEEFLEFVHDTHLDLGLQSPMDGRLAQEDPVWRQDVIALANMLPRYVTDRPRRIEHTRLELLQGLDWRGRVEFRSRHEFLVDDSLYQPITSTIAELERALGQLSRGYIGLFGPPGSGKSSLLTRTLALRPERIVLYYAYVPGSLESVNIRGESLSFYHDLVLALEDQGLHSGASLLPDDRIALLERFRHQLQRAHDEWREHGRKTILLIDGLDHVEREQNPDRSFLRDLPEPEHIPEGVLVVLGSQTDACLPERVQAAVRMTERRIEIAALSPESVNQVIEKAAMDPSLTAEHRTKVFELSAGHPLSLALLMNHLRTAASSQERDEILEGTEQYHGDIAAQYLGHWRAIDQDDTLALLLAHVARLRRPLEFAWIKQWTDPAVLRRLRRQFGHYFNKPNDNEWTFFHPSFRQFLLQKTSEGPSGAYDATADKAFHKFIAEHCAQAPKTSAWRWEELYHRLAAQDHAAVLALSTLEFFREQVFEFRPLDEVIADIRLAMRSLPETRDVNALVRLIVALGEAQQRWNYFDQLNAARLLLGVGRTRIALDYVRRGLHLRVGRSQALAFSMELQNAGILNEASSLFAVATPINLLTGVMPLDVNDNDTWDTTEAWVKAAPRFRSVDEIVDAIRRITVSGQWPQYGTAAATEPRDPVVLVRARLLFALVDELAEMGRHEDCINVARKIEDLGISASRYAFWSTDHIWRSAVVDEQHEIAKSAFGRLVEMGARVDLDTSQKIALATAYVRIRNDVPQAKAILSDIGELPFPTKSEVGRSGLSPYHSWIRWLRLKFNLGDPTPSSLPTGSPKAIGLRLLERALTTIVRLQAFADRGERIEWADMAADVMSVLTLYYHPWGETREWDEWYAIDTARTELLELLAEAAARHGESQRDGFAGVLTEEWRSRGQFWPHHLRRGLLKHLRSCGASDTWLIAQLHEQEASMLQNQDITGRAEQWRDTAGLWLSLGKPQEAERLLTLMVRHSAGVGYRKDYQLDSWIGWLDWVNKAEPGNASMRVTWFAEAIDSLSESTEGRATSSAAEELLRIAYRWHPSAANTLLKWFMERGTCSFEDMLAILLEEAAAGGSVRHELIPNVFEQVLLRIGVSDHGPVVKAILLGVADRAERVARSQQLLNAIDRLAMPEVRPAYRYHIARACEDAGIPPNEIGLAVANLDEPDRGSPPNDLRLKDGTALTPAQVRARIKSYDDLESLFQQLERGALFSWRRMVPSLFKGLSKEELERAAALFEGHHEFAFMLSAVSRRLAELGEGNKAWMYAARAFEESNPNGWSKWYDGGTRLAAARALVAADPVRARSLLFDELARGACGMGVLLDILPLLLERPPYAECWRSVESYCQELFSHVEFGHGPNLENSADDSVALAELTADMVDTPVTVVRLGAIVVCALGLVVKDPTVAKAMVQRLSADNPLDRVMNVLEAASTLDGESVSSFGSRLEELAIHDDLGVRMGARRILVAAGLPLPPARSEVRDLPAIYSLVLPPAVGGVPTRVSSTEPLPDLRDPFDDVRPFQGELRLFAEASGIPYENLARRASRLMEDISPRSEWSADAEKRLRSIFGSVELRFTFVRPRARVARQAIFRVLQELLDARMLPFSQTVVNWLLRTQDPVLTLLKSALRPAEIQAIGIPEWTSKHREWCDNADTGVSRAIATMDDGRIVLAEQTTLRDLQWGAPEEVRKAGLRLIVGNDENDAEPFAMVRNRMASEYGDMDDASSGLAVWNTYSGIDSPSHGWLAVNPNLPRQMGWHLAEGQPFRWVDQAGAVAIESVWWTDGLVDHHPPRHCEVGEGWIVLVAPWAFKEIVQQTGPLLRAIVVERQAGEASNTVSRISTCPESIM